MNTDQILLKIALNLTTTLNKKKHYQYLINSIHDVFPCDACSLLLRHPDGFLTPVAISGISNTVLERQFFPQLHPRLQHIIENRTPVRFKSDCALPDPFDGMLLVEASEITVHDCLGCSLYVEDELIGVLTLDALDIGAFDHIDPIILQTFAALAAATMRNITQYHSLQEQNQKQNSVNQALIQQVRSQQNKMIGLTPEMQQLRANIRAVAQSNYAVLIDGETGTGKELVAHQIHEQSSRSDKPMIYVNCAALPEHLAESELFGHIKGAFTGANTHRAGKFELADGGTLFLDEIGELPLSLQSKLLRVLQQGELQRVGSDDHLVVDVRIIAATNRELDKEVLEGRFRADLYHRLNVFPITVPPLRHRKDDIPILAGYLLEKVRAQFQVPNLHIHPNVLPHLSQRPWQGNIRELEHTLTRAALRAIQENTNTIQLKYFEFMAQPNRQDVKNTSAYFPLESHAMRTLVEQYQKDLIQHALLQSNGAWSDAAKFLQMDRGNLHRMGKKLGL